MNLLALPFQVNISLSTEGIPNVCYVNLMLFLLYQNQLFRPSKTIQSKKFGCDYDVNAGVVL